MKKKYLAAIIGLCLSIVFSAHAQKWVQMMQDPNTNFYDVQKEFNRWWAKQEKEKEKDHKNFRNGNEMENEEEEGSYTLYKRWEEFMEPRVYPSGKRFDPSLAPTEYQKYLSRISKSNSALAAQGNWTLVGPTYQGCSGRINCVRFSPVDTNTVYAGAASGGLWKSTDKGAHWATNTDNLGTLGVSDLAFDPTNANVMYLATGDRDGNSSGGYTIGLLKSTNGGTTWNSTGISNATVNRVIVNPTNPSVVLIATNGAVWRSTDGATTFTHIFTSSLIKELTFKPGDPTVVYAASYNTFYRSSDGGQNFSVITSGLPSNATINLAIGTTIADPNYVYVLASDNVNFAYNGLYLSTDAGLNFTLQSNSPNIIGGQGQYDLAIAVSPVNKAEVVVGGLNIYRSVNSGVNWTQISSWNAASMTGTVHVDIHNLQYYNGTTIYTGCDGGVFSTANSGANWSNLCSGLQVIQPYSVGISQNNPNLFLIGTQDNGTKSYNGAAWSQKQGSDGNTCFIDWSSDTYQYISYGLGPIQMEISTNGGGSFSNIGGSITESVGACWMQDPDSSQTLYSGCQNVWKSTDRGSTWNKISSFAGGTVNAVAVCAANNNCICAVNSNKVYLTTNGGTSWNNITGTLPTASSISDIAFKSSDPNKIWVAFSGFVPGNKVYETSDGGITWKNISGTLPNLPANAIVYQKNSPDGLYLGMDIGVYYRDTIGKDWVLFNAGLPNSVVRKLKIQNASGKLVACTYGRGIWESDLHNFTNPASPVAIFSSSAAYVCSPTQPVTFTDASIYSPTSWLWNFGDGTTSAQQNPVHTFTASGTYNVQLKVSNANGADSLVKTNYITVAFPPGPVTTGDTVCGISPANLKATPSSPSDTLEWYNAPVAGTLVNIGTAYTTTVAATTTYYIAEVVHSPVQFTGALTNTIGAGGYGANKDARSPIIFDVYRNATLNAVTVYSDSAGNRTIQLADGLGNVLQSYIVNVPKGQNRVALNFNLTPGSNYRLQISGFTYLYWNSAGAVVPMTLPGVLSITGNSGAPGTWYYYFYNWEVQPDDCISERAPVTATVDCASAINSPQSAANEISIYPNPAQDKIYFEISLPDITQLIVSIYSIEGKLLVTKSINPQTEKMLDVSMLSDGIYFLRFTNDEINQNKKIIISR